MAQQLQDISDSAIQQQEPSLDTQLESESPFQSRVAKTLKGGFARRFWIAQHCGDHMIEDGPTHIHLEPSDSVDFNHLLGIISLCIEEYNSRADAVSIDENVFKNGQYFCFVCMKERYKEAN